MNSMADYAPMYGWLALVGIVLMLATTMLIAWLVASIVHPRVQQGSPEQRVAKLWSKVLAFPVEIMAYAVPLLAFMFFIFAVAMIFYPILQMT